MKLAVYLARSYAAVVALTLLGLVVLVVAAGLIEGGGQLTRATSPAATALKLGGLRAAEFSYHVLPAAAFLAALITGAILARRGELLAVYAAGVATARVALVFLGVAAALGAGIAAAGEWAIPRVVARIARVEREELGRVDPLRRGYSERAAWFRRQLGDLEMVLHLPAVDLESEELMAPAVYLRRGGELLEVLSAERLAFVGGRWQLFAGERLRVRSGEQETFESLSLTLDVRPADLIDVAGDPRQMTRGTLARIIARRQTARLDTTSHEVELYDRWVQPSAAVLLVLLAVPWAVAVERRRSLALALGAGVAAIGAHLAMSYVFRLLALAHDLSPLVGAWGGSAVALGAIPLSLLARRRVETRGRLW